MVDLSQYAIPAWAVAGLYALIVMVVAGVMLALLGDGRVLIPTGFFHPRCLVATWILTVTLIVSTIVGGISACTYVSARLRQPAKSITAVLEDTYGVSDLSCYATEYRNPIELDHRTPDDGRYSCDYTHDGAVRMGKLVITNGRASLYGQNNEPLPTKHGE